MMPRTCIDCSVSIGARNVTGRCRKCALVHMRADPSFQARRLAGLLAVTATAEWKEKHRAAAVRIGAEAKLDPRRRALMSDNGKRFGTANFHHSRTPQARENKARANRARLLAWCPEPYWPLNQTLTLKGFSLADRKRMVATTIASDERRWLEALTPFERQLERVRNGAQLVTKPTFRTADPAFTLGGVATGML